MCSVRLWRIWLADLVTAFSGFRALSHMHCEPISALGTTGGWGARAVLYAALFFFAPLTCPALADSGAPRSDTNAAATTLAPLTRQSGGASSPILVVVALPLTGPRYGIGAAFHQRLSRVKSAINADGGVAQHTLSLEVLDDACDRETARALAMRVVAMTPPPAAVIGHPCASAAITAAPIYQHAGILFLAAGMRHPQLSEMRIGPLVFRAAGRDDRQGTDAGHRLRTLAGLNGASLIIHDRTILARSLASAARQAASNDATTPPAELAIVAGENDYTKTIEEIADRKPAALLFCGFPSEAAIILRQLRARGIDVPFIVNDAMATPEFLNHAGDLLASHVEIMMPVSINREAANHEATGRRATSDALIASDVAAALSVWADTATDVASTDPAQIAQRLSLATDRPEGIGFDSAGDAIAPSFAPFRRRNNAWQRADLHDATLGAPSPAYSRSTVSQPAGP